MKQLKQAIGFTFESFSFIFGGILIGQGTYLKGLIFVAVAFALAVWTGSEIKKDTLSEHNINSHNHSNN